MFCLIAFIVLGTNFSEFFQCNSNKGIGDTRETLKLVGSKAHQCNLKIELVVYLTPLLISLGLTKSFLTLSLFSVQVFPSAFFIQFSPLQNEIASFYVFKMKGRGFNCDSVRGIELNICKAFEMLSTK